MVNQHEAARIKNQTDSDGIVDDQFGRVLLFVSLFV